MARINSRSFYQPDRVVKQLIRSLEAEHPALDGREMRLSEALLETVGRDGGTLISCIAGKLAYFELEPFDGRYILER